MRSFVFGSSLHSLIVHFPVVLVILLPIVAGVASFAIRRGAAPKIAWLAPLAISIALTLSTFVAVTGVSGSSQIAEHSIERYELAAERFLVLSAALAGIAAAGLSRENLGRAGRLLTTLGAVGLVAASIPLRQSGGLRLSGYRASTSDSADSVTVSPRVDLPSNPDSAR